MCTLHITLADCGLDTWPTGGVTVPPIHTCGYAPTRRRCSAPLTTTELALKEYDVAALMDRLADAMPSLKEARIKFPLPRRYRITRIGTLVTTNAERLVRYKEKKGRVRQ